MLVISYGELFSIIAIQMNVFLTLTNTLERKKKKKEINVREKKKRRKSRYWIEQMILC